MDVRTLIIVTLSVALLLAVGVLVFGVARVVFGIAYDCFRKRTPAREVRHPVYGVLTSDGTLWTGIAHSDGREVPFTVAGTDAGPDEGLLNHVGDILGRFAEVERRAVEFLRGQEAEVRTAAFDVYGLDLLDEKHPEDFMIEFVSEGDEERV